MKRTRSGPPSPTPEQLVAARERFDLSQEEAAGLIFSARRTWQQWEGGKFRMHPQLWETFLRKGEALLRERGPPVPKPPRLRRSRARVELLMRPYVPD